VPYQQLTQRQVALGGRVLERRLALLAQDLLGGALDLGAREQLRCRQPACERDDVGLLGEFEQLTDHRARHSLRALRETLAPQRRSRRCVLMSV
jgi:hypothetical protein